MEGQDTGVRKAFFLKMMSTQKSSKQESDVTLFVVWMVSANNVEDEFPKREGLGTRALH